MARVGSLEVEIFRVVGRLGAVREGVEGWCCGVGLVGRLGFGLYRYCFFGKVFFGLEFSGNVKD